MKRPLLLLALLSGLAFTLPGYAQPADQDSTQYQYEYNHEYHYEFGPWGYRAEAQLMDSLAVLEMMGQMPTSQVRQEQDKFRKTKKDKQQQKKEKMRKKKKAKKRKDKNKKN